MPQPRNNLRLFVGIYPSHGLAEAMLSSVNALELPEHRLVHAAQLHLTLHFIGETPQRELDQVLEAVQRSAAGLKAFELIPAKLISLPQRGPARLIAVETDRPPALLELQRRLAHRLARTVRQRAGDRFCPHLTLCRLRTPTRIAPVSQDVQIGTMWVREIRLMRSTLTATGAQHTQIAAAQLT